MSATILDILGRGLYTPTEAALFARVAPQTMMRWVWGSTSGKRVLAESDGGAERSVTFLQFVEALAIRNIRLQHSVPLQKIREASLHAASRYGVAHPFARRDHRVGLLGRELVIELSSVTNPVYLTGRERDQMVMKPIVQQYLKDLTFGPDGLALSYVAWRHRDLQIEMNPRRQFGEPLLPSGHSAQTLWSACIAEGGAEPAARAFGVPIEEVEAAFEYFDHLERRAA